MAPRPRRRSGQGNARIDAALDYASGQLGFAEQIVRKTVIELLNVYGGNAGWPFIEEGSYTVLIDAILAKQQNSAQAKEDARRVGDAETSSAATPVTGVTEASSSNLVQASDALDSASQTNDVEDPFSLGNVETDDKDSILPSAQREEHGESIRSDLSKNEQNTVDINATGTSARHVGAKPVESSSMGPSMIQTSQPVQSFPLRRRKPCHGWIRTDDDHDEDDLVHLPPAPLPEELEKLLGWKATSGFVRPKPVPLPKEPEKLPDWSARRRSEKQRRRKSRWDEKPEGF